MIITEHIRFCFETVLRQVFDLFLIFFCIVLRLLLLSQRRKRSVSCFDILWLFPKRECQFVSFVCHSGQTRVKAVLNQFDQNWESFRLFCGHFCNLSKQAANGLSIEMQLSVTELAAVVAFALPLPPFLPIIAFCRILKEKIILQKSFQFLRQNFCQSKSFATISLALPSFDILISSPALVRYKPAHWALVTICSMEACSKS